jgi:Spy/CpxP family protein refolding chaperone
MKLRKIAPALAFCSSLVSISHAQMPRAAQMQDARAQRMMAVARQLHLTPEQTKQLIPILQAQEPQLKAIMNDQSLSRMEKLRRLRAVHDQSNPQVKAILTPEQFQQLQIIRQQRRAQHMQAAKQSNQGSAARTQQK